MTERVSWPTVKRSRLCRRFGEDCLIGAGTVLSAADCARVADVGGRLMVSPNIDADMLATAQARRMVTMPGIFSPTEALFALRCGACSGPTDVSIGIIGPADSSRTDNTLGAEILSGIGPRAPSVRLESVGRMVVL